MDQEHRLTEWQQQFSAERQRKWSEADAHLSRECHSLFRTLILRPWLVFFGPGYLEYRTSTALSVSLQAVVQLLALTGLFAFLGAPGIVVIALFAGWLIAIFAIFGLLFDC